MDWVSSQALRVSGFLTPTPAGGLLAASSSVVPRSALQTRIPGPSPSLHGGTHPQAGSHGRRLEDRVRTSPSVLLRGRLLRSRPIAPEGPLPSPLTLLTVDGTSQAREHPLTFSSRPRAHVPSCCFSSFLLLSSYPVRQGSFLS